jgi:hypothetical protein
MPAFIAAIIALHYIMPHGIAALRHRAVIAKQLACVPVTRSGFFTSLPVYQSRASGPPLERAERGSWGQHISQHILLTTLMNMRH